MAEYNKTDFVNLYGSSGTSWTSTPGSLTDADFKQFGQDIADSLAFLTSIKTVRREVSSAEILALNTTPVSILAAPGSGYMLSLINLTISLTYGTVAYVQGGNALIFGYAGFPFNIYSNATFLQNTSSVIATVAGHNIPAGGQARSDLENKAFTLSHATADPTTGDGTLLVDLVYSIITL